MRYRLAVLQFARGDADAASVTAGKLAADKAVPTWIRAQSLLVMGRAHDLAGRRDLAKQSYERVIAEFEKESAVWPAKVGLVTPYRRPLDLSLPPLGGTRVRKLSSRRACGTITASGRAGITQW